MSIWATTAVLICSLAFWVHKLSHAMPPPFDDVVAVDIPEPRLALFPGNSQGAVFPPVFNGTYKLNEVLKDVTRLFEGVVIGSESVAVTPSGTLVMIDRLGFVFRAEVSPAGYQLRGDPIYIGPGRPLGFHMIGERKLYVCDSLKGLLRVNLSTGAIEVLSNAITGNKAPPQPINYVNDLDVATDGSVYFTSCTEGSVARNHLGFYDTMRSYLLSAMRGAADGMLLRWDPTTRKTSVLASGLAYANGVALSKDESWVAVVETNFARIHRHWLKGPKKGQTEILVSNLPGMPDGISRSLDGGFWVALVSPLSPIPRLVGPYRMVRQLLSHAIAQIFPLVAKKWGAVIKLDKNGQPVQAFYDTDGSRIATISAATESGSKLFLGNLGGDYVSYLDLSKVQTERMLA